MTESLNDLMSSWLWRGKLAMSAMENHYFRAWDQPRALEEPGSLLREVDAGISPPMRYSSPWPWVLALAISSTMWVGIGWVLWKLV